VLVVIINHQHQSNIRDQCFRRFRVHLLASRENEQAGPTLTESLQIPEHMVKTLIINTVNGLMCNKMYFIDNKVINNL